MNNQSSPIRTISKRILRPLSNALVASASTLSTRVEQTLRVSPAVMDNPYLPAKFYPHDPQSHAYSLFSDSRQQRLPGEAYPVPPLELMEGYGPAPIQYIQSGREDYSKMVRHLIEAGCDVEAAGSILDFGCSSGRMIRHFPMGRPDRLFGVDISAANVAWATRYLPPEICFTTTTALPHLPFEDRTFDLVYAGSVFTHISDLADAWILELKRVLKPGAFLYLTLHDRGCIEVLIRKYPDHFLTRLVKEHESKTPFLQTAFGMVCIARSPRHAMVFYDDAFVKSQWGQRIPLVKTVPEAYGYQTAWIFRRS